MIEIPPPSAMVLVRAAAAVTTPSPSGPTGRDGTQATPIPAASAREIASSTGGTGGGKVTMPMGTPAAVRTSLLVAVVIPLRNHRAGTTLPGVGFGSRERS
ncbi:hypothetical protein Ntsu_47230 [Nocardia sp. IFM 10818]